jgi:hypothetical protein
MIGPTSSSHFQFQNTTLDWMRCLLSNAVVFSGPDLRS